MSENTVVTRYSRSEILARRERGDDPLDLDAPEAEEMPDGFWDDAVVVDPGVMFVQLWLDAEVVEWFRSSGDQHLRGVNEVLRTYITQQRSCRQTTAAEAA